MSRLHTSTRDLANWRERLADPDRQWKRRFSALETAVSWELASRKPSGLPEPIETLFHGTETGDPHLLLAVAEHKVDLPGGNAASQCDVWAIIKTKAGLLSLTVEAKANETFGDDSLEDWLAASKTKASTDNRKARFDYISEHLPPSAAYSGVRYQILHRCAAAVIEARRFGFRHAAFIVQAFSSPEQSFQEYEAFCSAIGIKAARGAMATTGAGGISLSIGWADCPFATDSDLAATL